MNNKTEKAGSAHCNELKGISSGKPMYSCPRCIETATELVEEFLRSECEK